MINEHAEDRFGRTFLIFVRFVFQNTFLQKLSDTPLLFGTAICMSGPRFLKKMAYNTFAVSIRLAILDFLTCFRARILLSTFRLGS